MKSTGKTGKKTVDHFLTSFLVPEIYAFKERQNGTKSGSAKYGPIIETLAKTGKFVMSPGLHVNK